MKAKHFLITVCIFVGSIGYSQNQNYESTQRMASSKASLTNETAGSKYFNENFMPATFLGKTILIRYNAFSDQIEFKDEENEVKNLIPNRENPVVTTTDKKNIYEYVDYVADKNENKTGYLNLISENPNNKIYSRYKIYLKQGTSTTNGYDSPKPSTYKKSATEYYIKIKDNQIVPLSSKKKDLLKLFPNNEDIVNKYISDDKISLSEEQDLIKLGKFLNTLSL